MPTEDFMGSSERGPAGENFREEERKRKLIVGSLALVGAVVATVVLLYAFGATSSGDTKDDSSKTSAEAVQNE